jgi:hypothetical protein
MWSRGNAVKPKVYIAVFVLVIGSVAVTAEDSPRQRGSLLPLQDRTGMIEIAALVEVSLRQALEFDFAVTPQEPQRNALRRQRIRDAGATPPAMLLELANQLEVGWFFSPTLHAASSNPVGLTVSAWAYRVESNRLAWAGFSSSSGTGPRRALYGQSAVTLETLAQELTRELVDDFRRSVGGLPAEPVQVQPNRDGFLLEPMSLDQLGVVAVLPFESVTDKTPMRSGETLSAIARAALYSRGIEQPLPGRVESVLRRRGIFLRGELDPLDRAAISAAGQALHLLAGTVEVYESTAGQEPRPRVAFSVRLIGAEDGKILWFNGEDRTGWDRQGFYGLNRIYDPGSLAEAMMQSMLIGILE